MDWKNIKEIIEGFAWGLAILSVMIAFYVAMRALIGWFYLRLKIDKIIALADLAGLASLLLIFKFTWKAECFSLAYNYLAVLPLFISYILRLIKYLGGK